MIAKPFVNLHTHSHYSILEAISSPKAILQQARSHGQTAIAITDSGNGHGWVDFVESAQKLGDIKPILGVELALSESSRFEKRAGLDGFEGYVVLLVENQTGFENLLQLISLAHLEGYYSQPRIDWELLEKHASGLICLTGALGGALEKKFHRQGPAAAIKFWDKLHGLFGDKLWAEICVQNSLEQKALNQFLATQSWPKVVTTNARFTDSQDEEAATHLYAIGKNQNVHHCGPSPMSGSFAKNWETITRELSYLDFELLEQARTHTCLIADQIEFQLELGRQLLPYFEIPNGKSQSAQLREDCQAQISVRYQTPLAQKDAQDRLDYELSIISKMGFDSYFLIVADLINFARANGIAVGPGRGSAAGSIVAYLLGITNIDPIGYELLFERFLNPERVSMPDIDIDFSDERREEVLQYVIEKYGAEKVSKVCTFGTLAAKAALKDVGRARGVEFSQMNTMTKLLPNKPGFGLNEAEEIKEFTDFLEKNPELQTVFSLGKKLEGCVRHVSVHACAIIIAPGDLSQFCPIQWAPGSDNLKITQFPYQQLEHIGLLKMDFLGLKNLSILEKATLNIKKSQNLDLDLNQIPIDDAKTFAMMAEGQTTGVFQFESTGMRRYLKELKPTEFEDLVAMNALYRPGPMEYIPQYIKGKHQPKSIKYLHPDLETLLQKTYGIAVYQEQVLRIAQEFAGFSLGEADILRKAIGKKIVEILDQQRTKFIEGAVAKGYAKKLAIKIFDDIVVPFSGYGFNRSHAVCYARIAYETAYLRANFPVEFMAAMMTTDRHNTDRIVLEMKECQDMGIEVLPPSVNESGSHFTVVKSSKSNIEHPKLIDESDQAAIQSSDTKNQSATTNYAPSTIYHQAIRFGLTAIKGLGEDTVDILIAERQKNGSFKTLQDFAERVPAKLMNKKTLEALAFSGALDQFGNRKAIVDSLEDLAKFARLTQEKANAGQMGLFGGIDESAIGFTLKNSIASKEDILSWERESLGLFVSDHPLKDLHDYFEKYGSLINRLNEDEDGGQKRTLHGLLTSVRKIVTKQGKNMAVFEIEDTSGKIECAMFSQSYEKIDPNILAVDNFVRVRGKIDQREGLLNCKVDEIKLGNLHDIRQSFADQNSNLYTINVPDNTPKETVTTLKQKLIAAKAGKGQTVQIRFQGKTVDLPFLVRLNDEEKNKIDQLLR